MSSPQDIERAATGDGSFTLRRTDLDEPYHSMRGAVAESRHVFIRSGLEHSLSVFPEKTSIVLLEMGFGTGLNALLTLEYLSSVKPAVGIEYRALETQPLNWTAVAGLQYCTGELSGYEADFRTMHAAPWGKPVAVHERFTLVKLQDSWHSAAERTEADLIYYDAFGPRVQPELWDQAAMDLLSKRLKPGGIMVTYCAQGAFKRALRAAGLVLERLPGPPGKREMIRAQKPR
jgi:tRNA U34 5-methylaminomethyl-2-thiouridine-forming methyltransferase MnmC